MLLGIVLHGMLSFITIPQLWPPQDIHQNSALYGFFVTAIQDTSYPLLWPDLLDLGTYFHSEPIVVGGIAFRKVGREYQTTEGINMNTKKRVIMCVNSIILLTVHFFISQKCYALIICVVANRS